MITSPGTSPASLSPPSVIPAPTRDGSVPAGISFRTPTLKQLIPPAKITAADVELTRLLGFGAYSRVVLGTLNSTGVEYAVKIVSKELVHAHNKIDWIFAERNTLRECDHPNIVKLVSTFSTPSELFYVLEYCARGELSNLVKSSGRLSLPVARSILAELVLALRYLHCEKGIIHRDLKAENVLLAEDWHVKLCDFATSKESRDSPIRVTKADVDKVFTAVIGPMAGSFDANDNSAIAAATAAAVEGSPYLTHTSAPPAPLSPNDVTPLTPSASQTRSSIAAVAAAVAARAPASTASSFRASDASARGSPGPPSLSSGAAATHHNASTTTANTTTHTVSPSPLPTVAASALPTVSPYAAAVASGSAGDAASVGWSAVAHLLDGDRGSFGGGDTSAADAASTALTGGYARSSVLSAAGASGAIALGNVGGGGDSFGGGDALVPLRSGGCLPLADDGGVLGGGGGAVGATGGSHPDHELLQRFTLGDRDGPSLAEDPSRRSSVRRGVAADGGDGGGRARGGERDRVPASPSDAPTAAPSLSHEVYPPPVRARGRSGGPVRDAFSSSNTFSSSGLTGPVVASPPGQQAGCVTLLSSGSSGLLAAVRGLGGLVGFGSSDRQERDRESVTSPRPTAGGGGSLGSTPIAGRRSTVGSSVRGGDEPNDPDTYDDDEHQRRLALHANHRQRAASFVGTAQYISPELLVHGHATYASDLWALGVIAFYLLAGYRPFHESSDYLTFRRVLQRAFSFPADFPPAAQSFVSALLQVDPCVRLGVSASGAPDYNAILNHPFFTGVDFVSISTSTLSYNIRPLAPQWVRDRDVERCRGCARHFDTFLRKHHCRRCGLIFCRKCSSKAIRLPAYGFLSRVRVCDSCFSKQSASNEALSGHKRGGGSTTATDSASRAAARPGLPTGTGPYNPMAGTLAQTASSVGAGKSPIEPPPPMAPGTSTGVYEGFGHDGRYSAARTNGGGGCDIAGALRPLLE